MTHCYRHLSAEERAAIMLMRDHQSIRAIARQLGRAPSTLSRELARHTVRPDMAYDTGLAGYRARLTRCRTRRCPKLTLDEELFELVVYLLRKYWSPEQIARTLKRMLPDNMGRHILHEAIYNALYLMPRGSLKKELMACLRQGNGKRRPRSRGKDRRQQIPDLVSIHLRPPDARPLGGRPHHRCQQTLCRRYMGRANHAVSDPGKSGRYDGDSSGRRLQRQAQ